MKERPVRAIITLEDYGDTNDEDDIESLGELLSYADASFSFNYRIVKDCESCNGTGIFYFTRDNLLKDAQICGKCKGTGELKLWNHIEALVLGVVVTTMHHRMVIAVSVYLTPVILAVYVV